EGERRRVVAVTIGSTLAAAPKHEQPVKASSSGGLPRAIPIALMAAGGVSLLVASYLWISGLHDRSSMESSCAPSHTCSDSTIGSARGKLVAGDVLGGLGLGLAGVGAWLYFSRPPSTPAGASSGAMMGWRGQF